MSDVSDETDRLAALASLEILDTPPERAFDAIVATAQRMLGCKIALISMVDAERLWFKANRGLPATETPRAGTFCSHAVTGDDILVVPDATRDPRFATSPLVIGGPMIRFYAGMPIRARHGSAPDLLPMGTLCVIDAQPRQLDDAQYQTLRDLAQLAEALLEARGTALALARLAEERRRTLERLDRTDRQFRQAERMANIGSWRLTLANGRIECSEQTYAIHGLTVGNAPRLDAALDFYPPHARAVIAAAVARTVETGEAFDFETAFNNARGDPLRVRIIGELEKRAGEAVALVGVFQDITGRHAMEQALRHTAHTDELTGLANRSRFNQFLDDRIALARDRRDSVALLLIDLDHFKAVNDRCGHLVGDEVLRLMAARLQASHLAGSFPARLGGDEFVLVITCPKLLADLPGVLRRLLGDLRHTVEAGGEPIRVSATIGACWLDAATDGRSALIARADRALYRAKNRRRGLAAIAGRDGFAARTGDAERFRLRLAV